MNTYHFNMTTPTENGDVMLPTYSVLARTQQDAVETIWLLVKHLPIGTSWTVQRDRS